MRRIFTVVVSTVFLVAASEDVGGNGSTRGLGRKSQKNVRQQRAFRQYTPFSKHVEKQFHSPSSNLSHLHGIAKPVNRVFMSAPIEGLLMKMVVNEGDTVQQGDVLAVIDNRIAVAALALAESAAAETAELKNSKQDLLLAQGVFSRQNTLFERKVSSQHEYDEARVFLEKAKINVEAALEMQVQNKKNLELAQAKLESYNIRAPFSGQILQVHQSVGAGLSVQDDLLTLVDMSSLEVELHLPLSLFGKLQIGQDYTLSADEPVGCDLTGRMRHASTIIDSATKTFRCVFIIDNHDLSLPAGFAARLRTNNLFKAPQN